MQLEDIEALELVSMIQQAYKLADEVVMGIWRDFRAFKGTRHLNTGKKMAFAIVVPAYESTNNPPCQWS